jgi:hypothetical protein
MRHTVSLALVGVLSTSLIALAAASAAQPAGDVPRHRHFLQRGTDMLPIGPQVCENHDLQHAFNQFHAHVHVGTPGTFAMDHEHNRTDVVSRGC